MIRCTDEMNKRYEDLPRRDAAGDFTLQGSRAALKSRGNLRRESPAQGTAAANLRLRYAAADAGVINICRAEGTAVQLGRGGTFLPCRESCPQRILMSDKSKYNLQQAAYMVQ